MQLFEKKKQKFLHCPGTTGQAQNLATGQEGMRSDKTGQDRKRGDVGGDNHYFFSMILRVRTSFPVSKRPLPVLEIFFP